MKKSRKTFRDILLPNKLKRNEQKSQKINYAMKYMIYLIMFYAIKDIILIKIRDYQFLRNIKEINRHRAPLTQQMLDLLHNITFTENILIAVVSIAVGLIILYYCNYKMEKLDEEKEVEEK